MEKIEEADRMQVIDYLPLIKKLAIIYGANKGMVDDLIQEGFLAVYEAISEYDSSRGAKLETFLTSRIKYKYYELFSKEKFIHQVPKTQCTLAHKLARKEQNHYLLTGKYMTMDEKKQLLNASEKTVKGLERLNTKMRTKKIAYLDQVIINDEVEFDKEDEDISTYMFLETVQSDCNVEEEATNKLSLEQIMASLDVLTPKEKDVILYRLGFVTGKAETFLDMAKVFKTSHQNMGSQYKRGIEKVKKQVR